jgi:glycosyltransferase involved in cell wall biosynthesis
MASGLAVVSFDYAAARQFVRHGANGLAVPCDQPGAFVAAAAELARDDALRARLGIAAVASLTAQSWETIIQCFEADLAAVAAASAPR